MIELQSATRGVILPVQAQPGARQNAIVGEHAGRLKVAVTQAPEKGKANKALIEVLATGLGVKRSQVELISGETNSQKRFLVTGLPIAELRQRIDQALTGKIDGQ
ncbi:MAG: DUF167 domain-containing protein [Planctomycetaceae bacterium]|nr:MAG: DUF167 domain-containing protein [Planctomycetaceae bacterium]